MRQESIEIRYSERPSAAKNYARILLGSRPGPGPGGALPCIAVTLAGVAVNTEDLARYRDLCGLASTGPLPPLYPHVLAGPLHLALVGHPRFPLSMLGSVHRSNSILVHQPLDGDSRPDITCSIGVSRLVPRGLEFDIYTRVLDRGVMAWESVTTVFVRGSFGEPGDTTGGLAIPSLKDGMAVDAWTVPKGTGRRYARLTGDYNPIHLYPLTAKLFGFRRDIIHGMWTLARAVGKLGAGETVRIDAVFKGPLFMGSTARLVALNAGGGNKFDVFDSGNPKPVLCGEIRPPRQGETLVRA